MKVKFGSSALVARLAAAAAMISLSAPASADAEETDGVRTPICANSEIHFVWIDFGQDAPEKRHDGRQVCHGPCVTARKTEQLFRLRLP